MQPALAESWHLTSEGQTLTIKLRSGVRFSDGSLLDADNSVKVLPDALRSMLGPIFDDVERIEPSASNTIDIVFRRSSMLHLEALESVITRPGTPSIGTGPYMAAANSTTELRANPNYYLGQPAIDRIVVSNYPSVRAAWAEMLRGNLDMLYDVSPDALASLEHSSAVSTFVYTRHYQHAIALNSKSRALRSKTTRRALNAVLDRAAIVRDALNGHGVVSSGVLWPQYWALASDAHPGAFDPVQATDLVRRAERENGGPLKFTCLVLPNPLEERIAIEVKRQLAAVGVEMNISGISQEELFHRGDKGDYEAVLTEFISGPTVLRPLIVWSAKGPMNYGQFGNSTVETALEHVKNAVAEVEYRTAVSDLEKAFNDDPPAIFLAWSQRARAVTDRFTVPRPEPGRDILSTLRSWKPNAQEAHTNRN